MGHEAPGPVEVRGEFKPIATQTPGIHVCEHLPRLASPMDKVCLLRSMTHNMNVHRPACSEIFTGREYFGAATTDQASEQDWPSLSAMAMRYGRARGGLPPSVVLPWYLQFPGQLFEFLDCLHACAHCKRPGGNFPGQGLDQ